MNESDAIEMAYKNGFDAGWREALRMVKEELDKAFDPRAGAKTGEKDQ